MPVGPARMPLLDHLSELRRRLTIIIVCVLVTTVVVYMATPTLIQVLIDPIRQSMPIPPLLLGVCGRVTGGGGGVGRAGD